MAGAEANSAFQLAEFMEVIANELVDTGFVEGFEFCHYRAQRGMRVDGYWFNDEGALDLFAADFESRIELASLTQTEVTSTFKRIVNFYEASRDKALYQELEETSPEYGLARQIADRKGLVRKVNFHLLSERTLSERIQTLEDNEVADTLATYQVWDISRLQRQRSSRGHKEALDINFQEMFGRGISCLNAHLGTDSYPSFLIVMPGEMLADLYGRFGPRLLEQNVRTFLQARGNVNKGIRSTILNEPGSFFAYNNGITATAQEVETGRGEDGLHVVRIRDLQIVNGGQTTASLFHTRQKDKASLGNVFVQMKLSVIPGEASERVVPKISQYANTQNRVNAADFFSNHPFHMRIEEFSRRIWAPAKPGALRETKWFYERARGQYADAQSNLTSGEQRRFKAEYPKDQMFTKTDLAKFENVWDDHPKWVNLGAQKNFAHYAGRIGSAWSKSSDQFSEYHFHRAIARGLIFRQTERLVSDQPWYNGGYRANIVAYAIASINECAARRKRAIDFRAIWDEQTLPQSMIDALVVSAKHVNEDIVRPPQGISNISEWCKKELCWQRLQSGMDKLEKRLPEAFWKSLVSFEEQKAEAKSARKTQKMDDGIEDQKAVLELGAETWSRILTEGPKRKLCTPKEIEILKIAAQIPKKFPNEKQCAVLIALLEKARLEGILPDEPSS